MKGSSFKGRLKIEAGNPVILVLATLALQSIELLKESMRLFGGCDSLVRMSL